MVLWLLYVHGGRSACTLINALQLAGSRQRCTACTDLIYSCCMCLQPISIMTTRARA